jgi:hypothetical protein
LEHSRNSFTLDTYIHTIKSIETETSSIMPDVLTDFKVKELQKGKVK